MSGYPGTYVPSLAPVPGPPRRTYGKKRILDPELLDTRDSHFPAKKSRTLAPLPANGPKSSPLLKRPNLLSSSPIKRTGQDQNALDSPFLEPRSKAKGGMLRRTSSTRKPPIIQLPKPVTSRHFSLNKNQDQRKSPKSMHQDELRRKTSDATTTVSGPASKERSWLVAPPPRVRATRTRYISARDVEISFNPPAESTLRQGSPTSRARMYNHRKCHDSILSTGSDDDEDTVSVTRIFGAPPLLPKIKSKPRMSMDLEMDDGATPRAPPLIEQLCRSRSGSLNTTIRPLNHSFRKTDATDADDEMDANREPSVTKNDPALRALADACASMGLDEPGQSSPPAIRLQDSSPTNRPAQRHRKSKSTGHSSVRRLSPRAVYRLSQWPRVGMRIETKALSPNEDTDMFATYDFDKGVMPDSE
ncbi:hypothetical protein BN14_04469 [Rhizoctonia solani AG-1 IB]|uniref:Uncharacterized protein n=1 Tax=Thanatephorus cucumeris (strain AG1-IB / isolate 7/3/14) TaxID=1108050 RepID=M5BV75_THACB|nr:hypothetical protein BN14_04469 [Rhizoctonia solani AG-1 IB]